MNGKSKMISPAPPFVLRLSKDERWVFQQNQKLMPAVLRIAILLTFAAVLPQLLILVIVFAYLDLERGYL